MASNLRAILVIAGLAALAAVLGVSLCPFATLTGLPCPGCGILRALVSLTRGDLHAAMHLHPMAPFAAAFAAFGAWSFRPGAPGSRRRDVALSAAGTVLLVAMTTIWLARFGGALGGPVSVNSVWSALGQSSPFARSATNLR